MKKKVIVISAALACVFMFGSCPQKPQNPNVFVMDKDTSYAMGMYIAYQFGFENMTYDYQSFMEGFRAYNEALETKFSLNEGMMKIEAAFQEWAKKMGYYEEEQDGAEEGRLFLAENGRRPGVTTTSSGLQYEVIVQGSGSKPTLYDIVEVHYEGTFIDGYVFDSSYQRFEPAIFQVGEVIQGWVEGLQLMNTGSTYILYVPGDLAYGPYGRSPTIPPNKTLIFKVELLSITEF